MTWINEHLDYVHAVERKLERRLDMHELNSLVDLAMNNGMDRIEELNREQHEMAALLGELTEGFVTTLKSFTKLVNTMCQCGYDLEQCMSRQKYDELSCCEYCEHASNVE